MAAYGTVEEFDTLYGLHVGVPAAFIGLWGALRFAVVAIGAALSIASMAIYAALTARRKQALLTKARREG